jgi:hypothetical protein
MTNETAQLLASLTKQQQLLSLILDSMNKPKLGLHSEAGSCKIYCNRQHGSLWYTLNGGEPSAIAATALTGYLHDLRFEKCDRRGKEVHKLLVTIQADRLYILESGHDTHFSKGLMASVATLTPQQLLQPVTIQPSPGDDDSVLFCRVWLESEQIKATYDDATDWRATAHHAIAVVKSSREMPF